MFGFGIKPTLSNVLSHCLTSYICIQWKHNKVMSQIEMISHQITKIGWLQQNYISPVYSPFTNRMYVKATRLISHFHDVTCPSARAYPTTRTRGPQLPQRWKNKKQNATCNTWWNHILVGMDAFWVNNLLNLFDTTEPIPDASVGLLLDTPTLVDIMYNNACRLAIDVAKVIFISVGQFTWFCISSKLISLAKTKHRQLCRIIAEKLQLASEFAVLRRSYKHLTRTKLTIYSGKSPRGNFWHPTWKLLNNLLVNN